MRGALLLLPALLLVPALLEALKAAV